MPKEHRFFDSMKEQSENILVGAKELKRFLYDFHELSPDSKKSISKKIKDIEEKGDDIAHSILSALDKASVTPLDKEEIHQLVHLLDDVIDLIESVSSRLLLFNVNKIDPFTKQFGDIILEVVGEVDKIISDLKNLKRMEEEYIKIHSLENKSDENYKKAMYQLFNTDKDPIYIIKYKEIYELLEAVNDKCEVIANVIESIVIKHA